MKLFQLGDYTIHISNRFFPISNEKEERVMIIYSDGCTIAGDFSLSEEGRLRIVNYWGAIFDVKGKDIFVYEDYRSDDVEVEERDESIYIQELQDPY